MTKKNTNAVLSTATEKKLKAGEKRAPIQGVPTYTDNEMRVDDIRNATVRADLAALCDEYRVLQEALTDIENSKKRLMQEIKSLGDKVGAKVVRGETWSLVRSKGGRKEIKPERLLEKGVKLSVIEYATVKQEWTYYQVTAPKAEVATTEGEG